MCNDDNLMDKNERPIKPCKGRPKLYEVCQHDGRLFATTYAEAKCEFEGSSYLETSLCTGISSFKFGFVQYN